MSLIVGRVVGEQVFLFADTEITYSNVARRPVTSGCLKLYRITPSVALGFAGDVADFAAFLPMVRGLTDAEEILARAEAAFEAGSRFDVLVAQAGAGEIQLLKNGKREVSGAGFVGDAPAYGHFQQSFHAHSNTGAMLEQRVSLTMRRLPEPLNGRDEYLRMFDSLVDVIESRAFPTVGGLATSLCTDRGVFTYMNYAAAVSDRLSLERFTEVPQRIDFGTAEGGGYALEVWPAASDPSLLAFYIPPGGFGGVFEEDDSGMRWARLVVAPTPAHWSLQTKSLGYDIQSSFLSAHHCGPLAEDLLGQNKFDDAVFVYELTRDTNELDERPPLRDRFSAGYAHALIGAGRRQNAIEMLRGLQRTGRLGQSCSALLQELSRGND
ncbi:hypothetical protein [Variovorax arabinosiphilus]|uniref:hypothetical protein n=1 Tax=Variovorax arabinosiphilus TaxID=3053498 RepID=UPI002578A91A|nr:MULTISPECIES: hypothetical protein [unclassified Variovorax]MDM0119686.1 hypothetical protein [Variovorax sp. J2L1-78]MDM0128402.1 hypothetical protein [Variovorax sp. J2L1-63]MDM0232102.1 hypothetical protein [Variovorax sp. J2R1-6]